MTFSTNVPNAGQSPGLFPAQNNTNFTRLKTIINADHFFNDSAAANDGTHRQVTLTNRSPVPTGAVPAGTNAIVYTFFDSNNVSQLAMWDGTRRYQITPTIIAAVNFDGTPLTPTIRRAVNVTSVIKTSTGRYGVVFSSPLPNNEYVVSITGMRNSSNALCFGQVEGSGTYSTYVTTTSLSICFTDDDGVFRDVIMGNVLIYGIL